MTSEPIGGDLDESITPERLKTRGETLRGCLLILVLGGFLYWNLTPQFFFARADGQLCACKSQLKNLATALEMYAVDNQKAYPVNLDALIAGHYLKLVPTCPSGDNRIWVHANHQIELLPWKGPSKGYTYSVASRSASFSLICQGDHTVCYKGFSGDPGGYPQYDSEDGLLDHP